MSETQFYNIAQIHGKADEIDALQKELVANISDMENIITKMKTVWQDATRTKFVQQFETMRPDLDAFCKNIATLSRNAKAHAEAVEKTSGGPV